MKVPYAVTVNRSMDGYLDLPEVEGLVWGRPQESGIVLMDTSGDILVDVSKLGLAVSRKCRDNQAAIAAGWAAWDEYHIQGIW